MTWPIAVTLIALSALSLAAWVASIALNLRAQKAIRDEQRDERETGRLAAMARTVDRLETDFKALERDTKLFMANNRRGA